jgi:hypothetical protein
MSSIYSVGGMNQLSRALRNNGFSDEDVVSLTNADLKSVKLLINGLAEIKTSYDAKYLAHRVWNFRRKVTYHVFSRKSHDIDLLNRLADALEAQNFSQSDVNQLKQYANLKELRYFAKGLASINYLIPDFDISCVQYLGNGWSLYDHQSKEFHSFYPNEAFLLSTEDDPNLLYLSGQGLADHLLDLEGLTANVANWLILNPIWIPKEWEGKHIVFPGTIFINKGEYYALYIYKFGNLWRQHWFYLHNQFPAEYVVAAS